MNTVFKDPLFDSSGLLCVDCLSAPVLEVMQALQEQLVEMNRRMFLPLDLLLVLLERGHAELARVIAFGTQGVVEIDDVSDRLRVLATEIEEDFDGEERSAPELRRTNFSRGFTRILEEAWEQATVRQDAQMIEEDLVRSVTWRAEAVESASIRWSIRRLSEGKGDALFDERGLLRLTSFDSTCKGILEGAMKLASSHGTSFLGTPHLVAMMASIRDSVVWRSGKARGLEPQRLREELLRLIGSKPEPIPEFLIGRKTLTPRMIRMLQYSVQNSEEEKVREGDLVEAFLDDGGSSLELVQALGLESEMRKALGEPRILAGSEPVDAAIRFASQRRASPTLDMLGRDLTEEALSGRLPEIVGRKKELKRVFNVLMRREQRNPLLTGEAGVGKTALAIGLAQHIASGRGPAKLRGYRVIEINGASLMSGTSYRGDLEARIKSLIEEASRDVILFIDEAHAVFSPRSGSNTPAEVPNHFKSALASGTIAVVGATTEAEFRRWFEQDPALKRRFERVEVEEPSESLVRHILESLKPELEEEYEVQIAPPAIDAAIDLSVHYLPEQRLPDKAKKLIMDACIACANPLTAGDKESAEEGEEEDNSPSTPPVVDEEAVARQVHLKTAIPLDRLMSGEITWWIGLETRLRESIVGQDQAMEHVAQVLVASRLKNADKRRPLSVLAFVGPPGVGKATAAEALARQIFYDERALIRLDMTDYQEAHALSRLIGSPPGYVGYEDVDMLVTPLRRRPSSVVLLEDFDRAHPRIQDRLLRLIEEGELGDTRGHCADATNAVFILTVSTRETSKSEAIGFGASSRDGGDDALVHLDEPMLATKLRDRVDGVVSFVDLSENPEDGALALLDSILQRFISNMESEYQIELEVTPELEDQMATRARGLGKAREVEALVDRHLVDPAARELLKGSSTRAMILHWDSEQSSVAVEHIAEPSSDDRGDFGDDAEDGE